MATKTSTAMLSPARWDYSNVRGSQQLRQSCDDPASLISKQTALCAHTGEPMKLLMLTRPEIQIHEHRLRHYEWLISSISFMLF